MGTWMPDITKEPTIAEKIEFAKDAGGIHLYWADYVTEHPDYAELMGDVEWHEECAILHGDTADELEELARLKGEGNSGCLLPFGRSK